MNIITQEPYGSRIAAWASSQSEAMEEEKYFLKKMKNLKKNIR